MNTFEIVPQAEIHRVVEPEVTKLLQPLGFESVVQLLWVRSADAPIRQVFRFSQWKGGVIAPSWGVSLDFVPHLSGAGIKWHRTPKSARLDLCVDARDRDLDMPYTNGVKAITRRLPAVIPQAVSKAQMFWEMANSTSKLQGAFEWLKAYLSAGGLGFYNYVQHPIALAFVLAMNGRASEGQHELGKFIDAWKHFGLDEQAESRLRQLFADAALSSKTIS